MNAAEAGRMRAAAKALGWIDSSIL